MRVTGRSRTRCNDRVAGNHANSSNRRRQALHGWETIDGLCRHFEIVTCQIGRGSQTDTDGSVFAANSEALSDCALRPVRRHRTCYSVGSSFLCYGSRINREDL